MTRRKKRPAAPSTPTAPPAKLPLRLPPPADPKQPSAGPKQSQQLPTNGRDTRSSRTTHVPESGHTLAPSADGNVGNLYADAIQLVEWRPTPASDDAETYRRLAEQRRTDLKRALELAAAAAELREAEHDAGVLHRRLARQQRAADRAAELEAARAAGGLYVNERRSPNRPCHANVDPGAWAVVKRDAIRRRRPVGEVVGALVVAATHQGLTPTHQSTHQQRTRRFARLLGVDQVTWSAFRVRALDADHKVADALGDLVEREARRLGWRPEAER